MVPELGVIEGYFGRPWRHEDRKRVLTQLRELGFSWFHHAPKADAFLRRRWREPHPPAALAELAGLSAPQGQQCASKPGDRSWRSV